MLNTFIPIPRFRIKPCRNLHILKDRCIHKCLNSITNFRLKIQQILKQLVAEP
jgi:hypothetical protein